MIGSAYRGITRTLGALPLGWTPEPQASGPCDLILHGASAGEVKAARCWLDSLEAARPELSVLQTSTTATGIRAGASARLPRDVPRVVAEFLERTEARALVLTEGDLWPNLLAAAEARSIRVGVVGARLTQRSARSWQRAGAAGRQVLGRVDAWAAASEEDAARLLDLGVAPDRVEVTGWLKWPTSRPAPSPAQSTWREGFPADRALLPLLVLGSVHPGEIRALRLLLEGSPLDPRRANWVAVARHEAAGEALRGEAARELPPHSWQVDERFGVLDSWYDQADAVFVGGGAKGRGVHDLLAPIHAGHRPLCFLDRGDPGGVGRCLAAEGLALPLDLEPPPDLAQALESSAGQWITLLERYDGRQRAIDFLSLRGVLP